MYSIKLKNRIKEDLEFQYANGKTALVLHVNINTDEIRAAVLKAQESLGIAMVEQQKNPGSEEAKNAVGLAAEDMLRIVFGEAQTRKLIEFFNGNRSAVIADVYEYLAENIFPAITEASESRKMQLVKMAKESS